MKNTLDILFIKERDGYQDFEVKNSIQFGYLFFLIYFFLTLYLLEYRVLS